MMVNVFESLVQFVSSRFDALFVGPRGYTVHADGHIGRGAGPEGEVTAINAETFRQIFGKGAEINGPYFFVPGILLNEALTWGLLSMVLVGRRHALSGTFKQVEGQLVAEAEFVWNRWGARVTPWFTGVCGILIAIDLIAAGFALSQGVLAGGDAVVMGLSLLVLIGLMFLPRALAVLTEKAANDVRGPVIAKLSALVQYEGNRSQA